MAHTYANSDGMMKHKAHSKGTMGYKSSDYKKSHKKDVGAKTRTKSKMKY